MVDFGRRVRLLIGKKGEEGISIENLRVDFSSNKTSESNSNKSQISIYNLNETTRQQIDDSDYLLFYVGYETSDTEYLFIESEIDRVYIEPNGLDVITKIETEEGKTSLGKSTFNKSYKKGTDKKKIILDAIKSLGLDKIIDEKQIKTILSAVDTLDQQLENGSTFSQKTKDVLDNFFKVAGISYSIQNGKLIVLGPNDTSGNLTYTISPSNGLIGNPVKTKEGCDIQTMLLPDLGVGMKIVLESKYIKGNFKVIEFSSSGSTHGNEFGMNIKLKELKS